MFTTVDQLPLAVRKLLDESWASTFYEEYFCKIDEKIFAPLYNTKKSRMLLKKYEQNSITRLVEIGEDIAFFIKEFNNKYRYEIAYKNLNRAFEEHYRLEDSEIIPKIGNKELEGSPAIAL